jgi:hypothetical protein
MWCRINTGGFSLARKGGSPALRRLEGFYRLSEPEPTLPSVPQKEHCSELSLHSPLVTGLDAVQRERR